MKKLIERKINFRKITIANIEAKKIHGGFVNPTEPTDDTSPQLCDSNVYCRGYDTKVFFVEPGNSN